MASVCSKKVINDVVVHDPAVQNRYVNLQKWAESDAEFVKRVTNGVHNLPHPTVVDSVSCRQMYLRSYTFSKKKETVPEKTKKCLTKVKEQVVVYTKKIKRFDQEGENKETQKKNKKKRRSSSSALAALSTFKYFTRRLVAENKMKKGKRRATGKSGAGGGGFCMRRLVCVRRIKEVSCGVLLSLFRRLLYCTT
ncbi:hypothetical protein QQ045_004452 [Rhodiola kirilowii]